MFDESAENQPAASSESQPAAMAGSSHSTPLHVLVRMGSSRGLVQQAMLYATKRSSRADDGKAGHGGECMPKHECLSARNFAVILCQKCLWSVQSLLPHVRMTSGVFTRILLKFLPIANCELGEIHMSVKKGVVGVKGPEQMPVRGAKPRMR